MIVYRRSYKRTWVVSWLALPRWRSVEEELRTDSLLSVRLSWWWWDGEWQYHRCRLGMCPGGDWGYREHWANNRQNDGRKRIRSDSNGIKLYSVFLMSYTTYTRTRKKEFWRHSQSSFCPCVYLFTAAQIMKRLCDQIIISSCWRYNLIWIIIYMFIWRVWISRASCSAIVRWLPCTINNSAQVIE